MGGVDVDVNIGIVIAIAGAGDVAGGVNGATEGIGGDIILAGIPCANPDYLRHMLASSGHDSRLGIFLR